MAHFICCTYFAYRSYSGIFFDYRATVECPILIIVGILAVAIFCMGLVKGKHIPFIFFPQIDSHVITAKVVFSVGTPRKTCEKTIRHIAAKAEKLNFHFCDFLPNLAKPEPKRIKEFLTGSTGWTG